ncbi:hypothetical protein NE237_007631 [Protea cynaroides]|uniref:Short-chain dehydrogenase TIC 32, chloroplastic n=1 Tax=Protea cynaroides TaxID=273540 RepID=A0A9Q0QWK4_9MAGN|nr:hypothetical protein NE237_007631 [Protea cynaroides]
MSYTAIYTCEERNSSSGIGAETAPVLALRGVHVVMGVRNVAAVPTPKVDVMELDLSSMASVRKFASDFHSSGLPLNILINNAGIMAGPFMLSQDNIELQFATNHVAHFLLTNLLLETMKRTAHESRTESGIVCATRMYWALICCQISHDRRINTQEVGVDITANSLHPGAIVTNILRHHSLLKGVLLSLGKYLVKNVQQGAATTCYVAFHPQVKGVGDTTFIHISVAQKAKNQQGHLCHPNERRSQWGTSEETMWPFGRTGPSGFSASATAEEATKGIDGTGLTAIVTGASSGIGAETARVLALRGVHVVMGVRNLAAGKDVKEAIMNEVPTAKVDVMEIDLSSMASVRKFASDFHSLGLPLNILINNAGIMACPFMLSQDNIELQFATNHVAHFLLTNLLLETMKSTAHESRTEGRIVCVSSEAHRGPYAEGIRFDRINDEPGYACWKAYGQSKLANILHAKELNRRLKEERVDITVNSLHPGVIATNLLRHHSFFNGIFLSLGKFLLKNVQQGAATTCYVALNPQVKGIGGEYFSDCNIAKPTAQAKDMELANKLWDFSMSLIG